MFFGFISTLTLITQCIIHPEKNRFDTFVRNLLKSLIEFDTVWCRLVNVFSLTYGVYQQQRCQNENKVGCQCDND